MKMLKNSESMISLTHDQLSNVMHKTTKRCFQHHYHHHDLIYECNIIVENKQQTKRRYRNKHKTRTTPTTATTTTTTKYKKSLKRSINMFNSFQNNHNNSTNRSIINNLSDICLCACGCRLNLKIFHLFNNYFTDIFVCLQKKSINLQLVLVIILSAIIACTAQSIGTQVNSQHKQQTTSHEFLVTAVNDVATTTAINFNNSSFHAIHCRHRIPNNFSSRAEEAENSFKFQMKISSRNLRHRYFKNQKKYIQSNTRNISVKWISPEPHHHHHHYHHSAKSHYQHNANNDNNWNEQDKDEINDYNNYSDSPLFISKIQKDNKNNNTVVIMENHIAKDKQKRKPEIPYSNINFYLKNLANQTVGYKKNINYNNKTSNKIKRKAENIYYNDENNTSQHDVDAIKNFHMKHNRSLKFVNLQQHVDHNKLIKIVLDGLGLKKVPEIEQVNISQVEYVTKYREYLQRVHMRKCRNLSPSEEKETFLKPLEILSINSKSTLLNHNQNHKRQKRNSFETVGKINKYTHSHEFENNRKQSLEERVRNILVLKKKHQKPRSANKARDERKSFIPLKFALEPEVLNLSSNDIEEANLRLVLIQSYILAIRKSENKKLNSKPKNSSCNLNSTGGSKKQPKQNVLNLKLFQLRPRRKRILLDERKIDIKIDYNKLEETFTQWLQFDVTKAVKTSIDEKRLNHVVLELQCDNCKRTGARILNEAYNTADDKAAHDNSSEDHQLMPVLNIIGHFDQTQRSVRPRQHNSQDGDNNEEDGPNVRHYHHQTYKDDSKNRQNRRTYCYKENQRCCRHSMEVIFKEIKGFEFIIQPKVFDAGYCHGRCPPRYNPAHHHALLQSLIWKQNHRKAPRPCCAPSKLVELEVLHVDEKDSNKLKISTWSDMKVAECACS